MLFVPTSHIVRYVLIGAAAFAFGVGADMALVRGSGDNASLAIREYDERFEYIRPLLICQIDEQVEGRELNSLESDVEGVITRAEREGSITSGSVYFRDLNSGHWIGVNELVPHSPASLLKVPIMMSYYKEYESDKGALSARYPYVRLEGDVNPLVTKRFLEDGRSYAVGELIRGMIVQSDNSAKEILTSHADHATLKETYNVLGIADPYSESADAYEISVKKYALFFRVLYNGTFLSREMSNKAAELLTEVEFDKGLRAGTPANIKVAHKYGVRAEQKNGRTEVELSDCGIVYNPTSPYLLCVMTEGSDPYVLADVIKDVAEVVYASTATQKDTAD